MFSHPPSITGDLIFFHSSKRSSFNAAAQSAARLTVAKHTHIAITIKQGNAIHAMPQFGVQMEEIRELLLGNEDGFLVLRKKSLQHDIPRLCLLEDSLLFHSRQRYNFLFLMRERRHASFCSELAAKAYERSGMMISPRSPSKTLPMDIFRYLESNSEWSDVTAVYQEFFLDNPDYARHSLAAKVGRFIEYTNQDMAYSQQILSDRVNALAAQHGHKATTLKPSRDYWSNGLGARSKIAFALRFWLQAIRSIWRK